MTWTENVTTTIENDCVLHRELSVEIRVESIRWDVWKEMKRTEEEDESSAWDDVVGVAPRGKHIPREQKKPLEWREREKPSGSGSEQARYLHTSDRRENENSSSISLSCTKMIRYEVRREQA